jgi:hypothetical protein
MQIVAAIVLAAVVFIAANHYVTRFGLLWWVAHTLVFALVLAFVWLLASMLFAPSGPPASDVGPERRQPTRAVTFPRPERAPRIVWARASRLRHSPGLVAGHG